MTARVEDSPNATLSLRMALFRGASVAELAYPLSMLAVMVLVLLPASVWAFGAAVDKGRRDGSLLHY